jgi:hypothetical protein
MAMQKGGTWREGLRERRKEGKPRLYQKGKPVP